MPYKVDLGGKVDSEEHQLFCKVAWESLTLSLPLSSRQEEICKLLFVGAADKRIAAELGIGLPTVRTHLASLFQKFDAQDRCELLLKLFRQLCDDCKKNGHHSR